jgi:small subunit ribosomal protein S5
MPPNQQQGQRRDNRPRRRDDDRDDGRPQLEEHVVHINRVSKVQKGGRRFSFTALLVVGDRAGRVGVGYGKAKEVPAAIDKAREYAKRNMRTVPMIGGTIPHEVIGQDGAGRVLLKPAAPGSGVRAAPDSVRHVLECAGIEDCLTKILGTTNKINVVHATMAGLKALRRPEDVARVRDKAIDEVAPRVMLKRIEAATKKGEAQTRGEATGSAG